MSSRPTLRQIENSDVETWNRGARIRTIHSNVDDLGGNADVVSLARTSEPDPQPPDATIETWEELLGDVKARLRLTDEADCAAMPARRDDVDVPVQSSVQECLTAVNLLYLTLKHERSRRLQLEHEFFDMHTALAQARADLIGTQAEERRARHQAMHDSLTALPNRSFFRERLNHALSDGEADPQPLAVMYLDLDGFKPINDAYGHYTGDALLKIVARRLTRAVRAEDMVSRQGGDEFACLLADFPDREQLGQLASKLFETVSAPCKIGKFKLIVRPSIGIAMCPTDGATATVLLRHADAAMYAAKRNQIGYAFFDHIEQDSRSRRREDCL